MYEITVTRVICAAHAIRLPDGSCEPIHGHNWQVRLTVTAAGLNKIDVVMDFHELEEMIDAILTPANNRNLNDLGPFVDGKISPTAERVAWWVGTEIAQHLPQGVTLASVCVTEAPGCQATFKP